MFGDGDGEQGRVELAACAAELEEGLGCEEVGEAAADGKERREGD